MERWKDIPGFVGYYQASDLGRIKSIDRIVECDGKSFIRKGKILKSGQNKNGYLFVGTSVNGYQLSKSVHKLVALTFIPNPENKPQVNHINGVTTDNRVGNLEWSTASQNQSHAIKIGLKASTNGDRSWRTNLTDNARLVKCANTGGVFSISAAAKILGIDRTRLSRMVNGVTKNYSSFSLIK